MSEREDLLVSVANAIKTYRKGEIAEPTPEHVDRWLRQFTPEQQVPFLREFDHVIKQTFFKEDDVREFLQGLARSEKLAGSEPAAYWSSANFLNIQKKGQSQKEMLKLFAKSLEVEFGLKLDACGSDGGDFIYLDDVMFSGSRVREDLKSWIATDAPKSCAVHVIVAAVHSGGQYWASQKLNEAVKLSGKKVVINYWRIIDIEERMTYRDRAGVLWPTEIPNVAEVKDYIAALPTKFSFAPRQASGMAIQPFSSEAGRQVLEREFLIAGAKIRARCKDVKDFMRPLGFSSFGVGFGSMITTYRNCPNNCPLAMWWGDPNATSGALSWYPLLPRKGYEPSRKVFNGFTV